MPPEPETGAPQPAASDDPPPILVTGSHRSGTTITGRLLSVPTHVGYVREPFHKYAGLTEICRWWPYVTTGIDQESRYREAIEKLIGGRATYKRLPFDDPDKSVLKRLARLFLKSKPNLEYWKAIWDPRVTRFLVKDPLAAFASEWLHRQYGFEVVVLIRHPAAFVASLQRVDWRFDFDEFREQRPLMKDYLDPLFEEADLPFQDLVDEGAFLWRCFYTVLYDYLDKNPSMIPLRHEDLSHEPVQVTSRLYRRLDLPFSTQVQRYVEEMTGSHNPPSPDQERVHHLQRDSQANLKRWKNQLDENEISRIREVTGELADRFYDETDW